MVKYSKHFLKKLEDLFTALQYVVRYEKGSFNSGYCIVENTKIVVINKFYDTEGRINCLLEILQAIEVTETMLEEKDLKFFQELVKVEPPQESE